MLQHFQFTIYTPASCNSIGKLFTLHRYLKHILTFRHTSSLVYESAAGGITYIFGELGCRSLGGPSRVGCRNRKRSKSWIAVLLGPGCTSFVHYDGWISLSSGWMRGDGWTNSIERLFFRFSFVRRKTPIDRCIENVWG